MKRIFLILGMLACLCVMASCSHSHEKGKTMESDKTHHWYPCYDSECDAVLNKVEHTWGKGEITTKPTPTTKGIKTYLCTVCKAIKQEEVDYVPESTITKEQWDKAFSPQNFNNVTVKLENTIVDGENEIVFAVVNQANGGVIYFELTQSVNEKEQSYKAQYQEGTMVRYITSRGQDWSEAQIDMSGANAVSMSTVLTSERLMLASYFDSFVYNNETEYYEANNLMLKGEEFGFVSVKIKMADGRISHIVAVSTNTPATHTEMTFTDYGTTKPKNPYEITEK